MKYIAVLLFTVFSFQSSANKLNYYALKIKQGEGKKTLSDLYFGLKTYQAKHGTYIGFKETNEYKKIIKSSVYKMGPEKSRVCSDCKVEKDSFKIHIHANIDDDPTLDVWTIDSKRLIINVLSDVDN